MTAPVPEMRRAIEWLDYDASTVSVSANDLAAVLDAAEAMLAAGDEMSRDLEMLTLGSGSSDNWQHVAAQARALIGEAPPG